MADEDRNFLRLHDARWDPIMWKRTFFGFYSFVVAILCVFTLEFSFSPFYKRSSLLCVVILKTVTIIVDKFLRGQFKDDLLVTPIVIFMNVGLFMVSF